MLPTCPLKVLVPAVSSVRLWVPSTVLPKVRSPEFVLVSTVSWERVAAPSYSWPPPVRTEGETSELPVTAKVTGPKIDTPPAPTMTPAVPAGWPVRFSSKIVVPVALVVVIDKGAPPTAEPTNPSK